MGFLDALIYGVRTIYASGVELLQRDAINFGDGLTAVDNPATGRTDVTVTVSPTTATNGWFDPRDYGAVADYVVSAGTWTTDNLAAFEACLAAAKAWNGNSIARILVDGHYYLGGTLNFHQGVYMQGSGSSDPNFTGISAPRSGAGTMLVFPTNVDGLHLPNTVTPGGGSYSTIADLDVYCSYQGRNPDPTYGGPPPPDGHTGNGVVISCVGVTLRRVNVQNFAECGILISAGNNSIDPAANAASFYVESCVGSGNGLHGIKVEGGDATVGTVIGGSYSVNQGWGLYETTIGNTYIGLHCEANRGERVDIPANYSEYYVRNGGQGNASLLLGCYAEGTMNELDRSTQVIGNTLALTQFQINQDLSQGICSSIGARNVVGGQPLQFTNDGGATQTVIEFGERPDLAGNVVLNWSTPNLQADWQHLRYNDYSGWWEFNNSTVGRPFMRFPTTINRPRRVAPLFPDGILIGPHAALNDWAASNTLMSQTMLRALPTEGTYEKGDFVWDQVSSASALRLGWVCTTEGTAGTLSTGATGSIDFGSDQLTVTDTTDLVRWQYITIAGVSGVKQIVSDPVGYVFTIDSTADATVAGAAVAWSNPTFTEMNRAAQSIEGVSSVCALNAGTLRYDAALTSVRTDQSDLTTNGGTGAVMSMRAQNATGTTSTGGTLSLHVGTGTSANGFLIFRAGINTVNSYTLNHTGIFNSKAAVGCTSVTYDQATLTSGTGAPAVFKGQNVTTGVGSRVGIGGSTGSTEYGQVGIDGPVNFGRVSQAMADANQTLSVANSAKNIVVTTGALTATRTLTLSVSPTAGVLKFFRNSCTGGSVTVQWLTGTGVTIAAGASALISSDGTDATILMNGT